MKLFLIISAFIVFAVSAASHDLKHLPLGDNLKSNAPKVGHIWPCHIDFWGVGAQGSGPWLNADGKTYDRTKKPVVPGDVKWPHEFKITLEGDKRVFTTNDLPDHGTGIFPIEQDTEGYKYDRNPNGIKQQKFSFSLPANPQFAAQASCAPGAVGIMMSGVSLFSAIDAPGRDAAAHELQDKCNGHPQVTGAYHYHNLSKCLEDAIQADGSSGLLGYAVDGFGIYGPYAAGGKRLDSKDLDECHGITSMINWDDKLVNMYHYVATDDFPYTIGCMRGTFDFKVMEILSGPRPGWF